MEKKKFLLRIDPKLYDIMQQWADDEFRSVNGQIETILRDAARRADRLPKKSSNEKKSLDDT